MRSLAIALLVFIVALINGCNQTTTNLSGGPQFYPGNLQGQIFDATTGAPIGGADLRVTLVQGVLNRNPDKLITAPADPLVGEYAFANIPVEAIAINTFKLVVSKPGYQPFESEFAFGATLALPNSTPGYSPYYNKIGNVYLYPVGVLPAPVTINVTDSNAKPVAGVTVQMRQDIATNSPSTSVSANRLLATNGLLPAVTTAVTNAGGVATFAAASLALGAQYTPVALATSANGITLQTTTGVALIIGTGAVPLNENIIMATASNGPLAVAAASNTAGSITPSGVLNLLFNEPFTLDATVNWNAVLTYTPAGGVSTPLPAASGAATSTATVTGSSLVITPTFTTPVALNAASAVTITYNYQGPAYVTSTGLYGNSILANPAIVGHPNVVASGAVRLNN